MQARMNQPVFIIAEAMTAMQALGESVRKVLPANLLELVHLRASQINGCSVCLDMHYRLAKKSGETDERLVTVAGWRDAPYFTEAERAALALTENVTRLADSSDPVPDKIYDEAARHYNQRELAALLLAIANINVWNRLNVATRQVAGEWFQSADGKKWIDEHAATR